MKNISQIKLNQLMENLYLESAVNRIYEEASEFEWIQSIKPSWVRVGQKFINKNNLDRYNTDKGIQVGSSTFEIYHITELHGEPHLRFTHNDVLSRYEDGYGLWDMEKEKQKNYGTKFSQAEYNIDSGFWVPLTDCKFVPSDHPNLIGKTKSNGEPYGNVYCKPDTSFKKLTESNDFDWIEESPSNPLKWVEPKVNLNNVEKDEDGWPLEEGNGEGEVWLDVSNYTVEEKRKILNNVSEYIGGLRFDNDQKYCFDHDTTAFLIHCGHEENHFFSQENHVCCFRETYDEFLDYEREIGREQVERPIVDGGLFLNNLNESEEKPDDKSILGDIKQDLGIASKFITTFGTGIGAFMGPVTRLLEGSGVHLDKMDVSLLIITAISFMLNDTDFDKLKEKLRERGTLKHLKSVTDFINGTKNVINSVLKNVSNASYGLADILAFTFLLVPVMNVIGELINQYGVNIGSVGQLFTGLAAGAATYGVKSIIKRLRNKL